MGIKNELNLQGDETADERRERKRKSRWSTAKSFVPGMPTILPSDIDESQRQSYLCKRFFSLFLLLNCLFKLNIRF